MAVVTTERHSDGADRISAFIAEMQDLQLTNFNAYLLSQSDLLNLSFTVSLASIETLSRTAAIINFFTTFLELDFDAHLFNIQVNSKAWCQ